MKKQDIKNLIELICKFDGEFTLYYIPSSYLYDTKRLYSLYYGGLEKIVIRKNFLYILNQFFEFEDNDIDDVVEKLYEILSDDINEYINNALLELEMPDEYLKYFDRDGMKEKYEKFKNKVLELKNV
jgi:hypothetical protein